MSYESRRELLSELAGVDVHSLRQIDAAFEGLRRVQPESSVDGLITVFQEGGLNRILADENLASMARHLIYWLYTGTVPEHMPEDLDAPVEGHIMTSEDYFESLVWSVVKAHPLALSGGYYGYWHYPPEDIA